MLECGIHEKNLACVPSTVRRSRHTAHKVLQCCRSRSTKWSRRSPSRSPGLCLWTASKTKSQSRWWISFSACACGAIKDRIARQMVDIQVLLVMEETVAVVQEVVMFFPRERLQQRIDEQRVEVPALLALEVFKFVRFSTRFRRSPLVFDQDK